ncbi:MAG: response regulator, partial [Deltaproteobacteria bacterium]|nr:response regulator [Deltaproteobacteria bacterium]
MNDKRILVVEDEEMIADLIKRMLTAQGVDVVCLTNGESAWRLLSDKSEKFHTIL